MGQSIGTAGRRYLCSSLLGRQAGVKKGSGRLAEAGDEPAKMDAPPGQANLPSIVSEEASGHDCSFLDTDCKWPLHLFSISFVVARKLFMGLYAILSLSCSSPRARAEGDHHLDALDKSR